MSKPKGAINILWVILRAAKFLQKQWKTRWKVWKVFDSTRIVGTIFQCFVLCILVERGEPFTYPQYFLLYTRNSTGGSAKIIFAINLSSVSDDSLSKKRFDFLPDIIYNKS